MMVIYLDDDETKGLCLLSFLSRKVVLQTGLLKVDILPFLSIDCCQE